MPKPIVDKTTTTRHEHSYSLDNQTIIVHLNGEEVESVSFNGPSVNKKTAQTIRDILNQIEELE